jgi:PAS domain S-box-containing protein
MNLFREKHPSIKNRVRAVILMASIIVLLATALAFVIYEVISFKQSLVRNVGTLAEVIAENSAAPLAFENKENAVEILSALKAEPEIEAVALYDDTGQLFAKYPPNLDTWSLPARPQIKGYEFNDQALILVKPVMHEQKLIGTLYIRSSLQGLYERFWRYATIVMVVLLGSMAGAFVLSTFLQRRISNPILALTKAAQQVTEHRDYSVRASKLTEDELGLLTDAFNRMLAETQEHQKRLSEQARLLNLTFDAILVCDLEWRITFWNRGAEQMYGFTQQEAIGAVAQQLLRAEFPQPLEQITQALHRDQRWLGEVTHARKDGTRIYVASRWTLDRATGKQPTILQVNTDISERKAFQSELERLVRERTAKLRETIGELEAFSYSISHDMRAPLRAMQGYAKVLEEDYHEHLDPQARHYLDRIARAATRLDSLIQDVLAYSRVAKAEISLHPVDLEKLLEELIPNHPEFQPSQAQIVIEKPLHRVLGHEAYLTQCFTNLLGNAVKFVPPGVMPQIRIRTERLPRRIRVWVEDNGIGIDPAHHDRIFQIFGRVHPETQYGGTGIGLAIVRKAAQRMNGEVGVQSELGKGSRFWLLLHAPSVSEGGGKE